MGIPKCMVVGPLQKLLMYTCLDLTIHLSALIVNEGDPFQLPPSDIRSPRAAALSTQTQHTPLEVHAPLGRAAPPRAGLRTCRAHAAGDQSQRSAWPWAWAHDSQLQLIGVNRSERRLAEAGPGGNTPFEGHEHVHRQTVLGTPEPRRQGQAPALAPVLWPFYVLLS